MSYDELAEFHDLFMDEPWRRLRPALARAFGALPRDSLVLDLGAGSGMGTRVLAQVCPAEIIALEPSRAMRTVLIARVADVPGMRERVTVIAGGAPDAIEGLEARLDGFVAAHVLGHLSAAERAATFAALAARMTEDAVGLVTVQDEAATTEPGEPPAERRRRLGRDEYRERHLPASDGGWISEYDVVRDGVVVHRARFAGSWSPLGLERLRSELAPHGLAAESEGPRLALVRRAS